MKIHMYHSNSGKNLIKEYINNLQELERIDGYRVIESMEQGDFTGLNFKRWDKKIYEVYFRRHNRLFYVILDSDNIYLLHACKKQKNKTEMKDKLIVHKRAKELGKLLGKVFV